MVQYKIGISIWKKTTHVGALLGRRLSNLDGESPCGDDRDRGYDYVTSVDPHICQIHDCYDWTFPDQVNKSENVGDDLYLVICWYGLREDGRLYQKPFDTHSWSCHLRIHDISAWLLDRHVLQIPRIFADFLVVVDDGR